MSWLKLTDDFPNHPKILILDDAAFRLHITALCYCARSGTEGFVSVKAVPRLGPVVLAPQLVEARLWEPCEGGWEIHNYLDYNLSNEQVEERRAQRAEAGRLGGLARPKQDAKRPAKRPDNPVSRIPLTRTSSPVSPLTPGSELDLTVELRREPSGGLKPFEKDDARNDGSLKERKRAWNEAHPNEQFPDAAP